MIGRYPPLIAIARRRLRNDIVPTRLRERDGHNDVVAAQPSSLDKSNVTPNGMLTISNSIAIPIPKTYKVNSKVRGVTIPRSIFICIDGNFHLDIIAVPKMWARRNISKVMDSF